MFLGISVRRFIGQCKVESVGVSHYRFIPYLLKMTNHKTQCLPPCACCLFSTFQATPRKYVRRTITAKERVSKNFKRKLFLIVGRFLRSIFPFLFVGRSGIFLLSRNLLEPFVFFTLCKHMLEEIKHCLHEVSRIRNTPRKNDRRVKRVIVKLDYVLHVSRSEKTRQAACKFGFISETWYSNSLFIAPCKHKGFPLPGCSHCCTFLIRNGKHFTYQEVRRVVPVLDLVALP